MSANATNVNASHRSSGWLGSGMPMSIASDTCRKPASTRSTYRATTVLARRIPVGTGASRYLRHTPRSRSLTIVVGNPKQAPPSAVTVSSSPMCRASGTRSCRYSTQKAIRKIVGNR